MTAARKTGEVHFNTPDDVRRYVQAALMLADELELSLDDRNVLLPKIIDLLQAKQVFMEQPQLGGLVPMPGLRH